MNVGIILGVVIIVGAVAFVAYWSVRMVQAFVFGWKRGRR